MTRIFLLLLAGFLPCVVFAQLPPPCSGGIQPAEDCQSACIACEFNDYLGSTAGFAPGNVPGFCSQIQNDQWLGFIAGASNATFTVIPSNCTDGNGVQVALYGGCDESFIACNGGNTGNGNIPISITSALTPGTNYFLLIDGYSADQCDFTLTVSPASAVSALPPGPLGSVQGPIMVCPGATVRYSVPNVSNAGAYTWTVPAGATVNGLPSGTTFDAPAGHIVDVTFGAVGGTVCVHVANSCFDGSSVCKDVQIVPVLHTILPPVTICSTETPYELPWGDLASVSGAYTHTYASAQGCDSLFSLDLTVLNPVAEIMGDTLLSCTADTLLLRAAPSPGSLKTWRTLSGAILAINTDSLVISEPDTLLLIVFQSHDGVLCRQTDTIIIKADFQIPTVVAGTGDTLTCNQPIAQLTGESDAPGAVFAWNGPGGFTSAQASPQAYLPGVYTLIVTNPLNHCTASETTEVPADQDLPQISVSGGSITCNQNTIPLSTGATANQPGFAWSGPGGFSSTSPAPSVSLPGLYIVTVTDGLTGCQAAASVEVADQTLAPVITIGGDTMSCARPVGQLSAGTTSVCPIFSWSGPDGFSSSLANPVTTVPGFYTVTVTDCATGCQGTASATVSNDMQAPGAEAVGGTLNCAQYLQLQGSSPTPGVTFAWTGPDTVFYESDPVVALPGNYVLIVTAANGCTGSATAAVGPAPAPVISITQLTNDLNGAGVGAIDVMIAGAAIYSVQWFLDGALYSESEDLTQLHAGVYTAIVFTTNGCLDTLTAIVDNIVPTTEPAAPNWAIGPNPASDFINVYYRGNGLPDAQCILFDLLGRKMLSTAIAGTTTPLAVKTLPAGQYALLIQSRGQTTVRSVSIER